MPPPPSFPPPIEVPPVPIPPQLTSESSSNESCIDEKRKYLVAHLDPACFLPAGRYEGLISNDIADPQFVGPNAPGITSNSHSNSSGLATAYSGGTAIVDRYSMMGTTNGALSHTGNARKGHGSQNGKSSGGSKSKSSGTSQGSKGKKVGSSNSSHSNASILLKKLFVYFLNNIVCFWQHLHRDVKGNWILNEQDVKSLFF